MKLSVLLFISGLCIPYSPSRADESHYQDLIIGERAAGLGGAYISISDDPSGIYHNPAGIIYNFENYFSLSANAYKSSKTTFKKAIAGQDYTMESSGWIPNFFGATQNYGLFKLGFAILSPSSEVLDIDDKIKDISTRDGDTNSVRRRLLQQYAVSLYGAGAAFEAFKDFSVGISLFVGQLTNKSVNTQLQIYNGSPQKYALNEVFNDQVSWFTYPKLGLQWMPAPRWSVGAVLATSYTLYSNQKIRSAGTKLDENGKPASATNDITAIDTSEGNFQPNVIGPYELGLGVSYFPTRELLFTTDIKYYSEDSAYTAYKTIPVVNVALGSEWFVSEGLVLRGGLYTNNANTPKLVYPKTNQPNHVDFLGLTASVTFANPGSSFTLCTQLARGEGKGQILNGYTEQQDIEALFGALYITASYQL